MQDYLINQTPQAFEQGVFDKKLREYVKQQDEIQKAAMQDGLHRQFGPTEACNNAKPAERNPQISEALKRLEEAVHFEGQVIDRLSERLEPVMSLPVPETTERAKNPNEPTCPLAAILLRLAQHTAEHSDRLRSFLARLEV